jgi:DNA-directed RNA polymerase specialized sigma24 family protein
MKLPPFQVLVDRHAGDLHRYLVAVVGRDDAGDAFQDVMVAALRAYPDLGNDQNLKGWLFTVAHNQAVDRHRRRARRPAEVALVAAGGVAAPPTGGPRVDEHGLWQAVAELPPMQRSAVVLRYAVDLPYRDIAAVLGCSEPAARQNVSEALKNLREEIPS